VKTQLRRRFWLELGSAIVSTALLVLTVLCRDWIELAFGVDPDSYSGSLEWLIVATAFAVAIAFFAIARVEWRKASAVTA
jgi:hypothetical protein